MSFDLKTALTTIAPTLATMIGGPLAGGAVAALESACGIVSDPTTSLDQRKGAITTVMQSGQMTPDIVASIRKADQEHETQLKQLEFDLVKLNADHELAQSNVEASDRDSARKRETTTKDNTTAILAYVTIGGFLTVSIAQLVALLGLPDLIARVPPGAWALIGNVSGYLAAEAKAASAYYFGSSSGSTEKTQLLAQAPSINPNNR